MVDRKASKNRKIRYHVLPKIVDSAQNEGLLIESLAAAIAQNAPEAKERLKDFLEGRAKKVGE
jgi:hypothetical protein